MSPDDEIPDDLGPFSNDEWGNEPYVVYDRSSWVLLRTIIMTKKQFQIYLELSIFVGIVITIMALVVGGPVIFLLIYVPAVSLGSLAFYFQFLKARENAQEMNRDKN